jgi:hypothetical protein
MAYKAEQITAEFKRYCKNQHNSRATRFLKRIRNRMIRRTPIECPIPKYQGWAD